MWKVWHARARKLAAIFFGYPVSAFAGQSAFFFIISAFPFTMLLITLIGFIPGLEQLALGAEFTRIMPDWFSEFVEKIFTEIYNGRNPALISVAAASTLLAASKGFISLIQGLNVVYGIKEKRNYFAVRGMAVVCTLTMMAAMVLTLILLVFGDSLAALVANLWPALAKTAIVIISFRVAVIFILLTALFTAIYLAAPNRRSSVRAELPGAALAAVGWIGFSFLYALYIRHVNTYTYGSLTAAVLIMLWLYACLYIVFVGGEVNRYWQSRRPQEKRSE